MSMGKQIPQHNNMINDNATYMFKNIPKML